MFARLLSMKRYATSTDGKEELPETNDRVVFSDNGNSPPFSEDLFTTLLSLERKRAERSRKPFALMLIDASKVLHTDRSNSVLERLANAVFVSTRETDICGWYKEGAVIGVILTEIGSTDTNTVRTTMLSKDEADVEAEIRPGGGKSASGSIYRVTRKGGRWVVTGKKLKRIS